ncbi:hypothetical protein H310_11714 [Aphanomyces invadans]|uniref:Chromo domain-containing protein n=1 Tax=Aphanomyces invadans TaxID=157072 RepID=A0A024TN15_9STRA|nr:hypothetical protein H310_11714 [Aphanomyces invadans]ETV94752.1 hypothetical protein H310_11714 [Aphanomyces invadans]|eukprot:XP_008876697.1 hypothetical protein H310_11714 [Aphanomyces invadans]
MTVHLRSVNSRTEQLQWPMPQLEVALGFLTGSRFYFALDWFRDYWQLSLSPGSQELFTIMTHRGMMTPTRVSMGGSDSVGYCQSCVELIFKDVLYRGVLAWLDDILGYASTEDALLDILDRGLQACASSDLKLHPNKCSFFLKRAKRCVVGVSYHLSSPPALLHWPLCLSLLQTADFVWPTLDEIANIQRGYDLVWIPDEARSLQAHLLVIAHAHLSDHRGVNATLLSLTEWCVWVAQAADFAAFVQCCLHCICVSGRMVPRPLGEALHVTKPNELLHTDFLTLPKDTLTGWQYVLALKDDASGYCMLIGFKTATADAFVTGLDILSFARYNEGGHMVRAFGGVRPARDSFEVMVYWLGLSDDEATWEPLSTLLEDVPILLQRYFDATFDTPHVADAQCFLAQHSPDDRVPPALKVPHFTPPDDDPVTLSAPATSRSTSTPRPAASSRPRSRLQPTRSAAPAPVEVASPPSHPPRVDKLMSAPFRQPSVQPAQAAVPAVIPLRRKMSLG